MKRNQLSKKKPRVNSFANFFLAVGFLGAIFGGYLVNQRYNPQKLSFNVNFFEAQKAQVNPDSAPVAISIDSQKISLPIIPALVKDKRWEATTKGVSYLSSSAIPGHPGNSILYGHNWPNLLGKLKNVRPGDKITVNFSDNSSKDFLIESVVEVNPDQTSVLGNSGDNRITLYTCSGFLDSKRLVVVAKLLV